MDPDGDYESRHSIRSTASDNGNPIDDVASPSKMFAPDDDTKLPDKSTKNGDAYDGPTAPPMEDAPPLGVPAAAAAAASTNHRSAMEPRGAAYDDMISGKMDLAALDEAPISNSVAVPIGFDSDDMVLPEAKAIPIISSSANEGENMPHATLDEVDAEEGAEAQVDEEEPTLVPVPSPPTNSSTSSIVEHEKNVPATTRRCTRKRMWYCYSLIAVLGTVLGTVLIVLFGTRRGELLMKGYPKCNANPVSKLGNGVCNWAENIAECGWDGGDCLEFNRKYPDCKIDIQVGRWIDIPRSYWRTKACDNESYNSAECGWGAGDCVIDGHPNCNIEDTRWIGYEDVCGEFNSRYPNCDVRYTFYINDEVCDGGDYNTAECGWDGGDCVFDKLNDKACRGTIVSTWGDRTRAWCQDKCVDEGADCEAYDYNFDTDNCRLFSSFSSTTDNNNRNCWVKNYDEKAEDNESSKDLIASNLPGCYVDHPERIGDGNCDGGKNYNSAECEWDGGDRLVERYPDCHASDPSKIGNGYCDGGNYNTAECGWDGFDCLQTQAQLAVIYPDCNVLFPYMIGNGECQSESYNTAGCGWDGGDCNEFNSKYPNCKFSYPEGVGDGRCHQGANTAECSWDGGDCEEFNSKYPNCKFSFPQAVGDGRCHQGANTAQCGWDGGDCVEFNEQYPDCHVDRPSAIGNGDCNTYGEYNSAQCGWDGGDCLFERNFNKACTGTISATWNDQTRAWCQYKCIDERADCEAYDYRFDTNKCRLFSSYLSTASNSNRDCWKKK